MQQCTLVVVVQQSEPALSHCHLEPGLSHWRASAVARELLGKEDGRMGPRRKRGARVGFLLPHTVRNASLEETSISPGPAESPTSPEVQLEPEPVSPRLIRRQDVEL